MSRTAQCDIVKKNADGDGDGTGMNKPDPGDDFGLGNRRDWQEGQQNNFQGKDSQPDFKGVQKSQVKQGKCHDFLGWCLTRIFLVYI